jgi:hypothetical protein
MPSLLAVAAMVHLVFPTADTAGESVIRGMHARHHQHFPRTMAVVQRTMFANGTIETWYKTTSLPGLMRIDIAPPALGRTILFRGDSVYTWDGGILRGGQRAPYRMLTLLRDIFVRDPAETIAALRSTGFNLDLSHEATWEGRPVIVVGAVAGDSTSRQFWVDRERLVVVRFREPLPNGMPLDARMTDYRSVGGSWIEHEVTIRINGQLVQTDQHAEMTPGVSLEEGLFDTGARTQPQWLGEGLPRWP